MADAYRVIGVESSPYAVKVRAVMRYRHLPHVWYCRFPQMVDECQHVRPLIMPVVRFPDGIYRSDSTPILYELEALHPGDRSVIHPHPGAALLSHLIEDFADEWLTKSLFHYRFSTERDAAYGAGWVMDDTLPGASADELAREAKRFRERQIGRMPLVGAIPENAPLLEETYARVLDLLEPFVALDRFLFGSRPALADFGLIGQLTTLAGDLTASELMRARAPRTERWVRRGHDLSGVEGMWSDADEGISPTVRALLELAGTVYLPFLAANHEAIRDGRSEVEVELAGHSYRQAPYRYQQKCLHGLREEFAGLDADARKWIEPILRSTGCWDAMS